MPQKLHTIIDKSSLTDIEKSEWKTLLRLAGPKVAQDILDIVESNPEELEFLTKNLEDKIKAIGNPDNRQWDNIIKEEKEYLRNMG